MNNISVKVGGVGITPPNSTNIDSVKVSKSAEIDWFTVTFDRIKYKYQNGRYKIEEESYDDLHYLFKVLTADKPWYKYDREYGRNNYKEAIIIGQNIRIQFYGPENRYNERTTMIEFNGQACDEFINRGGDWITLIELMIRWKANCTRLDLAIDDFTGHEITPYWIWDEFNKGTIFFNTRYQNVDPITPINLKLGTYTGFGLYFGTRGKNQLLIYDKKLERESKGESVFYSCWYRYEMRFTGGKATTIMREFLTSALDSNDGFSKFCYQCLYEQLNIVDVNPNDSNNRRWKTNKKWLNFLEQVEKIKIINMYKPKQTIDTKREWIKTSVIKSLAQLFITDENTFFEDQLKDIAEELKELKDKDIELINQYLIHHGRKPITKIDIRERANELIRSFNIIN